MSKFSSFKNFQLIAESFREFLKEDMPRRQSSFPSPTADNPWTRTDIPGGRDPSMGQFSRRNPPDPKTGERGEWTKTSSETEAPKAIKALLKKPDSIVSQLVNKEFDDITMGDLAALDRMLSAILKRYGSNTWMSMAAKKGSVDARNNVQELLQLLSAGELDRHAEEE